VGHEFAEMGEDGDQSFDLGESQRQNKIFVVTYSDPVCLKNLIGEHWSTERICYMNSYEIQILGQSNAEKLVDKFTASDTQRVMLIQVESKENFGNIRSFKSKIDTIVETLKSKNKTFIIVQHYGYHDLFSQNFNGENAKRHTANRKKLELIQNKTEINFLNGWQLEMIEDLGESYNFELCCLLENHLSFRAGLGALAGSKLLLEIIRRLLMDEIRNWCVRNGIRGNDLKKYINSSQQVLTDPENGVLEFLGTKILEFVAESEFSIDENWLGVFMQTSDCFQNYSTIVQIVTHLMQRSVRDFQTFTKQFVQTLEDKAPISNLCESNLQPLSPLEATLTKQIWMTKTQKISKEKLLSQASPLPTHPPTTPRPKSSPPSTTTIPFFTLE
jgi:hypothetical protein